MLAQEKELFSVETAQKNPGQSIITLACESNLFKWYTRCIFNFIYFFSDTDPIN